MTLLHSGYNPKINLSANEMLEISQEISRDFNPCWSSQPQGLAEKIQFTPKKSGIIDKEPGRDVTPRRSSPSSKPIGKTRFTPKELFDIGEEISRDFTPRFSSQTPKLVDNIKFTPKELLAIGEEIGRDYAPQKSYKTPELMLLPVDPGHLYAYWNLNEKHQAATPINDSKHKLTLRIYAQSEKKKAFAETPTWFDVAIDSPVARQQISLPYRAADTVYSAAIGQCGADDGFIIFAQSNRTHASRGHRNVKHFSYCLSKTASGQGIGKPA